MQTCSTVVPEFGSPDRSEPIVLFLDFDGVLHDAEAATLDDQCRVVLDDPRLFEHLLLLTETLAPHPELRIIVSSDWQLVFDDASLVRLLGPLGSRVIGATETRGATRADAILRSAQRRNIRTWLALDDHPSVVEAARTDPRFIGCPSDAGISDAAALTKLRSRLAQVESDTCLSSGAAHSS